MGRWAQASRTGGGSTALNQMRAAVDFGSEDIDVEYTQPVAASSFAFGQHQSQPSGATSSSYTQLTPHKLRITMSDVIDTDTSLQYAGTNPNILSPDTIAH